MANIELDGANKKIKVDSGDLTLDIPGDIILDADGGDVTFADGGTNIASLTNSSSDLILESKVSDKDIIFKVNDGGSATEVARFDGDVSALKMASGKKLMLGAAEETLSGDGTDITFEVGSNGDINIPANIGLTFGDDGEKIEGDGTDMTISANNLTVDAAADITLDAAGNNFKFSSGGTQVLDIANSSSNIIIKPTVDAKDIIFQQYDGNEVMRINDSRKLQFYDDGGESITSDGSKLIIESGGTTFNLPTSDGSSGQAITTNGSGVLSFADAGGGKVLQVVSTFVTSTSSSTTSDTPVYWLNQAITPSASSSKILVLGMLSVSHDSTNSRCGGVIKRESTIFRNSGASQQDFFTGTFHKLGGNDSTGPTLPLIYLDSPSTTSSITYYLGTEQSGQTTYFNRTDGGDTKHCSTLTLLEIGA